MHPTLQTEHVPYPWNLDIVTPRGDSPIRLTDLVDNGNPKQALAILDKILAQNPSNKDALVEVAYIHLIDFKDPEKGLENLLALLKKNGLLRLGLYSKIARNEIIKFRDNLDINSSSNEFDSIKNLRAEIIQKKFIIIINSNILSTKHHRH